MLDIVVTVGLCLGLVVLIIAVDVIRAYLQIKNMQREIDTSFPQPATKRESNENKN